MINEDAAITFRDAAEILRRAHIAMFYRKSCSTGVFIDADANFCRASELLKNPTHEEIQKVREMNAALRARLEEEITHGKL